MMISMGEGTENFKKSKIPLTNKNLYLKSHDDFRGQGPGEKILKSQKFHLRIRNCI
jgi:hypothetical protein